MIDWSQLRTLRNDVGVSEFEEVLALFFEEAGAQLAALNPCAASLEADAHGLKGSALTLGFTALADLCDKAERTAADNLGAQVDITAIQAAYAASLRLFEQERDNALS